MSRQDTNILLDHREALEPAVLPELDAPTTAVAAPAESARHNLQSSFGNSLLAAAAIGDPPQDSTRMLSHQFGFGNAAIAHKLIQRKANENVPAASSSAATSGAPSDTTGTSPAATTPTQGLIVEDDTETVGPGQMKKSAFLAQARAAASSTVAEVAGGTPLATIAASQIESAYARYSGQSARQLEATVRSQAPEAAGATTAAGLISAIVARVRRGVEQGMSPVLTGVAGVLGAAGGVVSRVAAGVSNAVSAIVEGAGSVLSGIANIFLKARDDGERKTDQDPEAIQAQLGAGHSLDGGVKSRMESAFGQSFGGVEVHTDANASGLSENMNARAFTVGQHIAFSAGEYQPGTLIGDALIAHELAHVMQQNGGASAEPAQKGASEYGELEEDADRAAVGAVVSSLGGAKRGLAKVSANALPSLKSGLRLQRCTDDRPVEQSFLPMTAEEMEALRRMRQDVAAAEALLNDRTLLDEDREAIQRAVRNARGALGSYREVREQGQARANTMAPIGVASVAIVADDATGVGVADDPLLIVTGLAAIVTLIVTSPPAQDTEIGRQWLNVGSALDALGRAISTVLMAQAVGEQVRGNAEVLAIHLARLLGETVGGRPPDEPNDPNNFRHWWREIKTFLKNIRDKGLSPRQLMRELRKKFSEEEIESIRQAIRRAAERMGEDPPDFL